MFEHNIQARNDYVEELTKKIEEAKAAFSELLEKNPDLFSETKSAEQLRVAKLNIAKQKQERHRQKHDGRLKKILLSLQKGTA